MAMVVALAVMSPAVIVSIVYENVKMSGMLGSI